MSKHSTVNDWTDVGYQAPFLTRGCPDRRGRSWTAIIGNWQNPFKQAKSRRTRKRKKKNDGNPGKKKKQRSGQTVLGAKRKIRSQPRDPKKTKYEDMPHGGSLFRFREIIVITESNAFLNVFSRFQKVVELFAKTKRSKTF